MAQRRTDIEQTRITSGNPGIRGAVSADNPQSRIDFSEFRRGLERMFLANQQDELQRERDAEQLALKALSLDADTMINEVFQESPNNADLIKQKGETRSNAFLERIDPKYKGFFKSTLDSYLNSAIAKANSNLREIEKENALGIRQLSDGAFVARLKDAARRSSSPDPMTKESALTELDVLKEQFKADLATRALAPDGTVRISETEQRNRVKNFEDMVISSQVWGTYETSADKEAFQLEMMDGGYITEVAEGEEEGGELKEGNIYQVRVLDLLSPEAREALIKRVDNDIAKQNGIEDRKEQEEKIELLEKQNIEGTALFGEQFDLWLRGKRLTDDEINQLTAEYDTAFEEDRINDSWNRILKQNLMKPISGRRDNRVYNSISENLSNKIPQHQEIAAAFKSGAIDDKEAEYFRNVQENNDNVAAGTAPGAVADEMSLYARELEKSLPLPEQDPFGVGVDSKAENEFRRLRSDAMIDYWRRVKDPERVRPIREIFEEVRASAFPEWEKINLRAMPVPYKITKPRDQITYADVEEANSLLFSDKDKMSDLSYEIERKKIWNWITYIQGSITNSKRESAQKELREMNEFMKKRREEREQEGIVTKERLTEIDKGRTEANKKKTRDFFNNLLGKVPFKPEATPVEGQ